MINLPGYFTEPQLVRNSTEPTKLLKLKQQVVKTFALLIALTDSLLTAFSKEQKEKTLDEERSAPQSAFLGPTLWDKTLPYDGDTFQLEYMDLEEFLSENGIPSSPSHHHHHHSQHQPHAPPCQPPIMPQAPPTPASTVMDLSNHASTSIRTSVVSPNCLHSSPARAGKTRAHTSHLVETRVIQSKSQPTTELFFFGLVESSRVGSFLRRKGRYFLFLLSSHSKDFPSHH